MVHNLVSKQKKGMKLYQEAKNQTLYQVLR